MFKMDFYQFSNMFTFCFFILCLTFIVWTPVEGQSEVIGSTQPIIASPGDDVILPCHLDPEFNVKGLTVEWSKPDLKPDPSDRLSRVDYVHLYRDRREVPDMKIPAYLNRTELFTDELERGNISLKIMSVTLADEGRYRCLVPKLKSSVKSAIVELVVVPVHVLPTPVQTSLTVKGSHGRPPGSPMRSEIGCVQSVLDCPGREPSAILSCKPVEDLYLSADRSQTLMKPGQQRRRCISKLLIRRMRRM
ncbi:myelin-oligodendrocyte glycoprotein-like isoform X2 [Thunnus albacares]|uniref:myelin-oligodendrocyte glycoprotein-like isoform X2 n=1 Tax=Thunnus albacares TaxID=8236 RepID=UPI001CF6DB2F|nr:myelin-oligodendrocyte glycoprotein-like isoform X2 [Thunnus albacares]